MGIPATGKQIIITGTYIARFVGGKIVEEWGNMDTLGMMQQLGVIPPLDPVSSSVFSLRLGDASSIAAPSSLRM